MAVRNGVILDPLTTKPIGTYKGVNDPFSFGQLFTPDFALQTLNEFLFEYYQLGSSVYTPIQQEAYYYSQFWTKQEDNYFTTLSNSLVYVKASHLKWSQAKRLILQNEICNTSSGFTGLFTLLNGIPFSQKQGVLITAPYVVARLMAKRHSYSTTKTSSQDFRLFLSRNYPSFPINLEGYTSSELLNLIKLAL